MKSHRKELWFHLPTRCGFVNITPEVEVALRESGIKEGFVWVNASLSHFRHQISWLSAICEYLQKFLRPTINLEFAIPYLNVDL